MWNLIFCIYEKLQLHFQLRSFTMIWFQSRDSRIEDFLDCIDFGVFSALICMNTYSVLSFLRYLSVFERSIIHTNISAEKSKFLLLFFTQFFKVFQTQLYYTEDVKLHFYSHHYAIGFLRFFITIYTCWLITKINGFIMVSETLLDCKNISVTQWVRL